MNLHSAAFEMAAGVSSQLPKSTMPEIAFSGRSNVGKSSLINRLVNRKALARTSATPGKTATINFDLILAAPAVGGDYRDKNSLYFKGQLRSVAVYSTVRTAAEIKIDMNKPA